MGATQSKVVPIYIPAGEECAPTRKARQRWRKNFKLLSILCCSAVPNEKPAPICPTPPLYDYAFFDSDIETISLTSVPPPPMVVSDLESEHNEELCTVQSDGLGLPKVCTLQQLPPRNRIILDPLPDPARCRNPTPHHPKNRKKKRNKGRQATLAPKGLESEDGSCKTAERKTRAKGTPAIPTPGGPDSDTERCKTAVRKSRVKGTPATPTPGGPESSTKRCKTAVKKSRVKGKQATLPSEDLESDTEHCKTSVKKTGVKATLTPEGPKSTKKRCKTAVRRIQVRTVPSTIILAALESDTERCKTTVKKTRAKGKPDTFIPEDSESSTERGNTSVRRVQVKPMQTTCTPEGPTSSMNRCKTVVKKTRVNELKRKEAAATGPPTVRVPTPWPERARGPSNRLRESGPTRPAAVVHSLNAGVRYNGITRHGPITIPRNISSPSLLSEATLDELHSPATSQQHECPKSPLGNHMIPLRDSFDSLESFSEVCVHADPNVDASSGDDVESDDDNEATPYDSDVSQSPPVSRKITRYARPKASYGTVLLKRMEGWLATGPRVRTAIKCRRSNNMANAQRCHETKCVSIEDDDDEDDKVKKKEPLGNRLRTAIKRFRGTAKPRTSHSPESSSSDLMVTRIVDNTQVGEGSGQSGSTVPHPFSVGSEGWD